MKKLSMVILALVVTLSMGACGKRNQEPTRTTQDTTPITVPTTEMTLPTSNIPDPTVDSNSTMSTDATDSTGAGTIATMPSGE